MLNITGSVASPALKMEIVNVTKMCLGNRVCLFDNSNVSLKGLLSHSGM